MSELKRCPSCHNEVPVLIPVDSNVQELLREASDAKTVPSEVCESCFAVFTSKVNYEAQKKSKKAAKEASRLQLWRSRVQIIREARDRFALKDFGGAASNYEKYLRVLEIIYETKANEIKPTHFNNSARSKELVVIASAYWDLVRIYDQSKRMANRLEQCAEKLGEFLPFTPVYGEITRKVEEYKRIAKNKPVFDKILKVARKKKRKCFIATASFGDADAPEVVILARFRDHILKQSAWGKGFIKVYYAFSPPIARLLERSESLRKPTRQVLKRLAQKIDERFFQP